MKSLSDVFLLVLTSLAETYDDDPGSNDDFLGRTSLELAIVKEKGVVDEVVAKVYV